MAFDGGDFGAAAALVAAAAIRRPAGAYGGPNNDEWVADDTPGQPEQVNSLLLQAGQLTGFNASWDITNGDSGVLVSDAAEANEHGLPTNFGPGRGNWTEMEIARLLAVPRALDADTNARLTLAAALFRNGISGVVLDADGTDVEIGVHSVGTAAARTIDVRLMYLGGLV